MITQKILNDKEIRDALCSFMKNQGFIADPGRITIAAHIPPPIPGMVNPPNTPVVPHYTATIVVETI